MDNNIRMALGSVGIAVAVLAIKYAAYYLTGSVALFSDAAESVVNVAASVAALLAVRISNMPADENHPYGHHKAEYFSAVLEGVLIIIAALAIVREAYSAFNEPKMFVAPTEGLALSAAASVINGLWAWALIRRGHASRSPALVADGRHLVTDVVSSLGVLIGLGLVLVTRLALLDAVLAGAVAIVILWSGWRLMSESVGGLMDVAPPPGELESIRGVISKHAKGAVEAHDLRTRHAGRATFIEFHLIVPGEMTVTGAHGICDGIEKALKDLIAHAIVTIHVEPEFKAKHSGILVL